VGIVWIDMNRNGVKERNEPALPGIPVEASTLVTTRASRAALQSTEVRAGVIAEVMSGSHGRATTAADGSYRIAGLQRGRYQVVATLSGRGLSRTWDSGGTATWTGQVDLSGGRGRFDSAAAGTSSLVGSLRRVGSLVPVPGAPVSCVWAGLDGVLGTWDDAVMTSTTSSTGEFGFGAVPWGQYACASSDARGAGATSTASVGSSGAGRVALLVGSPSAGFTPGVVTVAAPPAREAAATDGVTWQAPVALPRTGSDTGLVVVIGLSLVVSGLALRRRSAVGR